MGRFDDDEDPRDPDREYDARRCGDKGPIQPTPVRTAMYKHDGNIRIMTWDDIQPGHVLRESTQVPASCGDHHIHPTFSDAIIVDATPDDKGDLQVRLVRPYLYATGAGTTCRNWMMGVEDFKVPGSKLIGGTSIYRIVLLASGVPQKMER
jgi:hypothetical protein